MGGRRCGVAALLFASAMITASCAGAQEPGPGTAADQEMAGAARNCWRVGLGFGPGSVGLSAAGFAAWDRNGQLLTLRITDTEDGLWGTVPNKMWDVGLLYGRSARIGRLYGALSAGVAYVHSEFRGRLLSVGGGYPLKYERIKGSDLGLPMQAEVSLRIVSFMALSWVGFADANATRGFSGLAVGLQFGALP